MELSSTQVLPPENQGRETEEEHAVRGNPDYG